MLHILETFWQNSQSIRTFGMVHLTVLQSQQFVLIQNIFTMILYLDREHIILRWRWRHIWIISWRRSLLIIGWLSLWILIIVVLRVRILFVRVSLVDGSSFSNISLFGLIVHQWLVSVCHDFQVLGGLQLNIISSQSTNKDMDKKQQYQAEDSLKLLLLKNAYIEIVAFLKKMGEISQTIKETIKEHMNNSANIISQDQQIDIESVFDTIITLYSDTQNSTQSFDETELVRNVLKHYVDNGDSKYIFVFYQLKTTQIMGDSQKIRWLLAADKFFPYFTSTINSTIAHDFGVLLEQGAKIYKNNINTLLQLTADKEQSKDQQEQRQKLRNQYEIFINNSLEYVVKFGAKQVYSNPILLSFLHKMIPTDFYFIHNQSILHTTLSTLLTHLPISISHSPTLLLTLPPLLFINTIRFMHLPLYSISSNLSLFFLAQVLLIILPDSANGQHPFNSLGKKTEEQIKQLVKSFCSIINDRNLWDDPKLIIKVREQTHLLSLMKTFRRLIVYLGYLSSVYDEQLHKFIKSTIVCRNASIVNQQIFWQFCLQEATNLKEPLEYRNFLINNYRNVMLESRNYSIEKSQLFFRSTTLAEKVLKKQIDFSCQELDTNNIGYLISFVMNYLTLLNCKVSSSVFKIDEIENMRKQIGERIKILRKKVELKSQESHSESERDHFDLCLLRMDEIQIKQMINQ